MCSAEVQHVKSSNLLNFAPTDLCERSQWLQGGDGAENGQETDNVSEFPEPYNKLVSYRDQSKKTKQNNKNTSLYLSGSHLVPADQKQTQWSSTAATLQAT